MNTFRHDELNISHKRETPTNPARRMHIATKPGGGGVRRTILGPMTGASALPCYRFELDVAAVRGRVPGRPRATPGVSPDSSMNPLKSSPR
jgi:hypothetical protein